MMTKGTGWPSEIKTTMSLTSKVTDPYPSHQLDLY